MLVDKMDQRKTVVPSVWSQLWAPLFKEVDRHWVIGLIGSMWFGTTHTTHLVRAIFGDCQNGSGTQSNARLRNLHQVAMEEGHLPTHWFMGADITRKETNNQTTKWLLFCVLAR